MKKIMMGLLVIAASNGFASSGVKSITCEGVSRFQKVKLWFNGEAVSNSLLADNYISNVGGGDTECQIENQGNPDSKKITCEYSGSFIGYEDSMSAEITLTRNHKGAEAFGFMKRPGFYGGNTISLWCEVNLNP